MLRALGFQKFAKKIVVILNIKSNRADRQNINEIKGHTKFRFEYKLREPN